MVFREGPDWCVAGSGLGGIGRLQASLDEGGHLYSTLIIVSAVYSHQHGFTARSLELG